MYFLIITNPIQSDLIWPTKVACLAITHTIQRGQEYFGIQALNDKMKTLKAEGAMRSLEEALLRALVVWKIPINSWSLYQPPQDVKLYDSPRSEKDKLNKKARKKAQEYIEFYIRSEYLGVSPASYIG